MLNGVDGINVFGEHNVLLGMYMGSENEEREITAIQEAIEKGDKTYPFRYATDVFNR